MQGPGWESNPRQSAEGRAVRTTSRPCLHPQPTYGSLAEPGCPSQAHGKGWCPRAPSAMGRAEPLFPRAPRVSYSESEVKDYLWQMLSAAQYLHAQRILHLDLRSENMIVTEYNLLKVVDLGNAQSLAQEKILPSERFKDYVETMGVQGADANLTWGEGGPGGSPAPRPASLPSLLSVPCPVPTPSS